MWNQIKIGDKNYFFMCRIIKNEAKFILYDLKESWCENITMTELIERAKELNKRIQFNSFLMEETLSSAEAVEANLVEDELWAGHRFTLRLKYRIDKLPFYFKWQLQEQIEQELRNEMTIPLFMLIRGMQQQVEELREVISRKDTELKQYRDEGAILRITTVATKPFDFEDFDNRFVEINQLSKGFQKLAESITQQKDCEDKTVKELVLKSETNGMPLDEDPCVGATAAGGGSTCISVDGNASRSSPRSRKRKSWEMQQKQMAKKLRARQQKLEYECSQSQTPPAELELEMDAIHQKLRDINRTLRSLEK